MIVVVGNPIARRTSTGVRAAGLASAVAREIAEAGGVVQVVGKLGEGPDGDAVALSLAAAGIGHVALQRVPAPVAVDVGGEAGVDDGPLDELAGLGTGGGADDGPAGDDPAPAAPTLEAADLELALRYLPDYRVVVLAQPLDGPALAAVRDAARWSGAQLIEVIAPGAGGTTVLDDATVFEAPAEDAEGAFASLVGRYAASLDAGTAPADAFAAASAGVGWAAVSD